MTEPRPMLGALLSDEERQDELERMYARADSAARPEIVPEAVRPRSRFTAAELMAETFPEPRWAIPGIIPEGLTVFAGPPKVGKSWFVFGASVAVAMGGRAFGRVDVDEGDVLYLALEDPPRRLQQRLGMMLHGEAPPKRLTLETECAEFPKGLALIHEWLCDHPDARMVIVDVFAKVRPAVSDKADRYLSDYSAVSPLKALADQHGVAIVLLHHTRKMGAEDFLDTISGTQGIAGAADTLMVLKRARNAADAILHITGRDVNEAEHAMSFDALVGAWTLLEGPASDYAMAATRRAIVQALRDNEGLGPKAVSEAIGEGYETVKKTMQRMVADDQLDTDGEGHYFAPTPLSLVSPQSPVPPPKGQQGQEGHGSRGDNTDA